MTFSYDSLGLCRHWSNDASGFIMKWHNRALLKDEFVSEWKARELAVGLASELSYQTDASSSFWTTSWSSRHEGCRTIPITKSYQSQNLSQGGQDQRLCMWVLQSLLTFGLAAKTPSRCITLLAPLKLSHQGHHHGAALISMEQNPTFEPLTSSRPRILPGIPL